MSNAPKSEYAEKEAIDHQVKCLKSLKIKTHIHNTNDKIPQVVRRILSLVPKNIYDQSEVVVMISMYSIYG